MIGHLARQVFDRRRMFEKRDRQIDGEFDVAVFGDEIAPILDRTLRDEGG